MAELVYAFDLKSNGETRAGSIPAPSTMLSFDARAKLKVQHEFIILWR